MMNLQGFGQIQGNTKVLPPIQGNTQVLPTITSDGFTQGANTVLQETAGLGTTDPNGFFGATTTTNDIFGDTLKTNTETTELGQTFTGTTTDPNAFFTGATTDANALFGENQVIQNVDTNTFFGTTGAIPTTTTETTAVYGATPVSTDPLFTNQTLAGTTFLPATTTTTEANTYYGTTGAIPTTTTDANAFYGTTQIMPDATAFGTQIGGVQKTTTTTTQTTYNTPGFQTTFGTTAFPTTYGVTEGTTVNQTAIGGIATQSEYPATGQTTPDSQIGYGTTAADLLGTQTTTLPATTYQTTNIVPTTTTTQTTTQTTTYGNTVGQQAETVTIQPQPQPQPVTTQTQTTTQTTQVPQTIQTVTPPPYMQKPQQAMNQPQIIQSPFGPKIIDEDFRRGRPIYNDTRAIGVKLNNNLPIRPSYNVGIINNPRAHNYGYSNTGFGVNKVGNALRPNNITLGTGLDRLGRGGSYDVYGRGINPILNKAGLGQVNNNIQTTSNLKDFL